VVWEPLEKCQIRTSLFLPRDGAVEGIEIDDPVFHWLFQGNPASAGPF